MVWVCETAEALALLWGPSLLVLSAVVSVLFSCIPRQGGDSPVLRAGLAGLTQICVVVFVC